MLLAITKYCYFIAVIDYFKNCLKVCSSCYECCSVLSPTLIGTACIFMQSFELKLKGSRIHHKNRTLECSLESIICSFFSNYRHSTF